MDAGGEPVGIALGNCIAGAAINDQCVRQVFDLHVAGERIQITRCRHAVAPDIRAVRFAKPHVPAAGDRTQAQVKLDGFPQARLRGLDLAQQGGTDLAWPDHSNRKGLRRQPERRVHGT